VFVKPDFTKYTAASAEAFGVFRSYDPRVAGASLDEAYLDVTQHCAAHGVSGEQVRARAVTQSTVTQSTVEGIRDVKGVVVVGCVARQR
jgi:DNA polymerase kappa